MPRVAEGERPRRTCRCPWSRRRPRTASPNRRAKRLRRSTSTSSAGSPPRTSRASRRSASRSACGIRCGAKWPRRLSLRATENRLGYIIKKHLGAPIRPQLLRAGKVAGCNHVDLAAAALLMRPVPDHDERLPADLEVHQNDARGKSSVESDARQAIRRDAAVSIPRRSNGCLP